MSTEQEKHQRAFPEENLPGEPDSHLISISHPEHNHTFIPADLNGSWNWNKTVSVNIEKPEKPQFKRNGTNKDPVLNTHLIFTEVS